VTRCGSKVRHQKYMCLEKIKDWTMCSKYANHSRFNGQHDSGDLYDL
jgi:hypothetical protein